MGKLSNQANKQSSERLTRHRSIDLAALAPRNGSARPALSNRCPALKAMREYEEQRMHMHCGNVLNSA